MPHFPKPFFKKSRGRWYLEINRRQINLGAQRDEAFRRYHELMAAPREEKAVPSDAVVVLVDQFLEWCHKHRAAETYRWYLDRLQEFCRQVGSGLTVTELRPYHVQRWVDSQATWSNGTRRNAIRAVKRVFNWAEELGLVDRSPLVQLRRPKGGKKDLIIPDQHFRRMMGLSGCECFRDLLIVTWETGCRPQESLRVQAQHVDRTNQRWVIPETPGKPDMRVVYLTDAAMEITERRALQHPEGPIFRNSKGRPWTTDAVNCHFHRLKSKIGVRYNLYALRHTWITRMLEKGVDSLTVAFLAGHKDPSMLAKQYAHLTHNPRHLLEQAKRATA
jgi:integrase/recombinase XerD